MSYLGYIQRVVPKNKNVWTLPLHLWVSSPGKGLGRCIEPHLRSGLVSGCIHTKTFVCLAYQGNDIMFRFIIEYSSSMDFGPKV
jgi:hypothetical protein